MTENVRFIGTPEFRRALPVIRKWEGGTVNHPRDPGGLTKWGISLRFLRSLRRFGMKVADLNGDGLINGKDILDMSEAQCHRLYYDHFWAEVDANELPDGVSLLVFDCAVNQGPGRAKRFLQKAARVKADGIIGPITMRAIHSASPCQLMRDFSVRRALHYSGLATFVVFGTGWLNRLFDVYGFAVEFAVSASWQRFGHTRRDQD